MPHRRTELSRCPIYLPTPEMRAGDKARDCSLGEEGGKYERVTRSSAVRSTNVNSTPEEVLAYVQ
jgi:hypothetical protein